MAFEDRQKARTYEPQDGDTLESIAERETAAGNTLTWQELARYNWGTDDPDEIDALLRDELGATARRADKRFMISAAGKPRAALKIPQRFRLDGLDLNARHVIRVKRKECPKQVVARCSLPGVTFGFNSSFIRPSVVEHLEAVEVLAQRNPTAKVMIFGHTDAVGSDLYNKKLSERRAWSVHAFITNDADAWETLYNHADEKWGLSVVQEILADLGHEPGKPDGKWGSGTRGAMRRFLGLPDDAEVQNDAGFRQQLFAAYMANLHEVDLASDRFVAPGYMGCGEFNSVDESGDALEANRRVTFYFFHPDRLPNLPCAFADCGPCQGQMATLEYRHNPGYRCSFYDSLAHSSPAVAATVVRVRLFDPSHQPLPHAPCVLEIDGDSYELTADGEGYAETRVIGQPSRGVIRWGEPDLEEGDEAGSHPFELDLYLDYEEGDETDEQAKWRLHHLGYPLLLDEPLADQKSVLFAFQNDHRDQYGLELTGELDETTRTALIELHDSCEPLAPGS